jgi:D-alanyl-D-alanine dipeptidase
MRSHETAAMDVLDELRAAPEPGSNTGLALELARSRATCRLHESAIEALTQALAVLRRGATALKIENRELRAEIAGMRPPDASTGTER